MSKSLYISRKMLEAWVSEGLSIGEIGEKYAVSQHSLRIASKNYEIAIPKKRAPVKSYDGILTKEILSDCVEQNMTAMEMAEHLKINVTTIRTYLKKFGLKPKRLVVHTTRTAEDEDLLKDAIYIKYERKAPIVEVEGKIYRNTFELLWEEPEPENIYARLDQPKKKMKGLYG